MSQSLQLFNFKDQDVRVVFVDGEPWWVLADICKILGLGNPTRVANRLKQDGLILSKVIDTLGREQQVLCINERNYFRLIFRSDKPDAVALQDWTYDEVLPSIRQTGSYSLYQSRKEIPNSEIVKDPQMVLQTLALHESMRLAFYRSARDWQGVMNILYPEQSKLRKRSKTQPPKVVIYQGEEVKQLMISFNQEVA